MKSFRHNCYSDAGRVKKVNQDSVFVESISIEGKKATLGIVCDGVGGLSRGEEASRLVVKRLGGWFWEEFPYLVKEAFSSGMKPGEFWKDDFFFGMVSAEQEANSREEFVDTAELLEADIFLKDEGKIESAALQTEGREDSTLDAEEHGNSEGEADAQESTVLLVEEEEEELTFSTLLRIRMERLFQDINAEVRYFSSTKGMQMGTTCTMLLLWDDRYYIAQVGDSRCYSILDGTFFQITEDQSLVQKEFREGRLAEEDLQKDSRRNVILQSIGTQPGISPVFLSGEVKEDEAFLICCDGFVHMLDDDDKMAIVNAMETDQVWDTLRETVESLKARGESDNVSVVVLY